VNPYQVLELPEDASLEDIKKRYRKLSLEHHPDRGGNPDEFRRVTDAYSLIDSEAKIKMYHSRKSSIFQWDKDLEEYFGDLFGAKPSPVRRTTFTDAYVTFEESFSGCEKQVFYKEVRTCRGCGGVGASLFDPQGNVKKPCEDCLGDGFTNQTHQTTVSIPRSVTEGYQLNSNTEDVIVKVHVFPHDDFTRKGFDVHASLYVSLQEVFSGSKIKVPTLHGDVEFDLPKCIQPDRVVRIKNKGFYDVRRNTYGDHLLTIKVKIPECSSEDCEKIVRCLDAIQKSEQ
jgi:molecular chaperone DnaJ